MYACAGGSLEVITWLHANGADIHHIDWVVPENMKVKASVSFIIYPRRTMAAIP